MTDAQHLANLRATVRAEDAEVQRLGAELGLDLPRDRGGHEGPHTPFSIIEALRQQARQAERLRATADAALDLVGKERDRLRARLSDTRTAIAPLQTIHRLADGATSWAKDTTRTRIRTLAREALATLDVEDGPDTCRWDDYEDFWESACGETYQFNDGGPKENRVRFCHGCGRLVRVVPPKEASDGEDESGE